MNLGRSLLHGKLKNKILITLALVGIIPLVALGGLSLYNLHAFHQADLESIERNLINQKVEEIKSLIEEIKLALELQVAFEQTSEIELTQQYVLLNQYLQEFKNIEEIAFLNLAGLETARRIRSQTEPLPSDELLDHSRTEKFLSAKSGQVYLSPIYFTLKGPMMKITSPVFNRNKIVISYLTAEVNLSQLQRIMRNSKLGETGYVYLIDENGFLIAHSQLANTAVRGSLATLPYVAGVLEEAREVPNRFKNLSGEGVVAAGSLIPDLRLAVIAEWPTVEADQVVRILQNQILVISLFVLIVILLVSVFLANLIVQPIKVLEQETRRVAAGKFDQPVQIHTHDEIEELGIAFNKMVVGLKQLEELKKEFVFIAAHELRTPVTAIKGYLSMVLEGEAGPVSNEVQQLLKEVITANERLIQLVNDLLQVARAEAGRLSIEVRAIDVVAPIQEVLKELKPLADQKKIKLLYESESPPQVMADDQRLKEVMVNLVGNAIKYTLGEGTVTISHERKDKELVTHVKDTGIGIPVDAQKKLFEKFYRVQDEKTRDITGTGLGLFIVKQIVEKMNGQIWVSSGAGQGSTFSFSLPLVTG